MQELNRIGHAFIARSIAGAEIIQCADEEVFGVPIKEDPHSTEGKPELVNHFQNSFALIDSAGLCVFVALRYVFNKDRLIFPLRLSEMMTYTTGEGYTAEEVLKAGERVYNLERMFVLKAGSTEDTLPPRMLNEPLPDGPAKGMVAELVQDAARVLQNPRLG